MTIVLINGKPFTAVLNGFQSIGHLTYLDMLEHGEIEELEVIEHD